MWYHSHTTTLGKDDVIQNTLIPYSWIVFIFTQLYIYILCLYIYKHSLLDCCATQSTILTHLIWPPELLEIGSCVGRTDDSMVLVLGASLSEPHTSVTSLSTNVCIYACLLVWTDPLPKNLNKRVFNITKIELMHSVGDRKGLLLECSVGYMELRWLKLKHTWQLTACLLQSSTAGCPQAVQISITTVVIKAITSGW